MKTIINGVRIGGISAAVPTEWIALEQQYANDDELDFRTVKKFIKSTGVEGRYMAGPRQTASDLCFVAADELLKNKNIDRSKIGVVVFVTQTEDYRVPASATVLQYRLGLGNSCIAFDVNLGCSGYTCGLNIACSLLMQSDAEYALLLCGDTSAREKNPYETVFSSNSDKMLFGDSGTATVLIKDIEAQSMAILSATDGSGFKAIISPYEWYRNPIRGENNGVMDGVTVFNFSTTEVPNMINELMKEMGTNPSDYDCLVLHQANKLILDRIAKATGFDDEKNIKSIHRLANTSSGSIPNTIVYRFGEEREGKLHCLLCGFGVGLSWSAVDCYIEKENVLPLVYTDEYFEDGYYIDGNAI